jgi:LDH2 family malate/lactate/ureidoglycolate dehydrogenase
VTPAAGYASQGDSCRVELSALDGFCRDVLTAAGADDATADAATRAMLHASRMGIDSHGVRLLDHYVTAMTEGRVNPTPQLAFRDTAGAVATLDADDAHGARASYAAMARAVELASNQGIGAVGIRHSSHFGPAGAYALAAAEAGLIGIAVCNSDSFVRLHDGAARFHGTNPIACAVPLGDRQPWLLDMATSAIPYNRIQLYRSLGRQLPPATGSDADGVDTQDPERAEMLAPLGGEFGFKGAGLAGLIEVLSAVATGMNLSFEIAPMAGPDLSTPRGLGAFVLALRPDAFVARSTFDDGMRRYLDALRASPARSGAHVMAPGDREWAEADRRAATGVPLDPVTAETFRTLADRYGLASPLPAGG